MQEVRRLSGILLVWGLVLCSLPLQAATAHRVAGSSAAYGDQARGQHGMVASNSEIASRVGIEIMQKGGNAIDAAIAVGLALQVTYPCCGNSGGGGFMMIRKRMAPPQLSTIERRLRRPPFTMYISTKIKS
ncbi:MAG: gamma-glutamyltransferase [Acidobacteria bacterium]|nr:gamma-glutamyltransferase [Acidobacteriota bacterium]